MKEGAREKAAGNHNQAKAFRSERIGQTTTAGKHHGRKNMGRIICGHGEGGVRAHEAGVVKEALEELRNRIVQGVLASSTLREELEHYKRKLLLYGDKCGKSPKDVAKRCSIGCSGVPWDDSE